MTHRYWWQCQCGVESVVETQDGSLAGVVRAARKAHETLNPCLDPDIERVETEESRERRLIEERFYPGGF